MWGLIMIKDGYGRHYTSSSYRTKPTYGDILRYSAIMGAIRGAYYTKENPRKAAAVVAAGMAGGSYAAYKTAGAAFSFLSGSGGPKRVLPDLPITKMPRKRSMITGNRRVTRRKTGGVYKSNSGIQSLATQDILPGAYIGSSIKRRGTDWDGPQVDEGMLAYPVYTAQNKAGYHKIDVNTRATLKVDLLKFKYVVLNAGGSAQIQHPFNLATDPATSVTGAGKKIIYVQQKQKLRIKNNDDGSAFIEMRGYRCLGDTDLEPAVLWINDSEDTYKGAITPPINENVRYNLFNAKNSMLDGEWTPLGPTKKYVLKPGQETSLTINSVFAGSPFSGSDLHETVYLKGSTVVYIRIVGDIAHSGASGADIGTDKVQVDVMGVLDQKAWIKDGLFVNTARRGITYPLNVSSTGTNANVDK